MKVAPSPGRESSSTRPPCASAIACTIESPSPSPSELVSRAGVAVEDPLAVGLVDPRALVADPEAGPVADQRAAEPDRLALAGVADGVLGQVHDRLGEPLLVGDDDPDPGAVEAPVAVAEAARLREQVVREQVEVDRARCAGSPAAAPWRAAAGRRRSGSSGRARPGSRAIASSRSSGESPSVSRCPRITVIGVRSSWLTSERKSFWFANAISSRSSMLLNVRPSSAISSLPRTGIRPERSVSEMLRAVRESAFERRDRSPGGEPDEQRGEQQDDDRDPDRDPHRALDLVALVGGQRGGDQDAVRLADRDRHGDVARLAERGVERRRWSARSWSRASRRPRRASPGSDRRPRPGRARR